MNVQLENIARQVKIFIEMMTLNGLNLVSNENIRQIEFFLQNSSQVEAYRLATSLRYLHVELKRFLDHNPSFNIERYVFFLSNCWLLCRAFLSGEVLKEKNETIIKDLQGALSKPKILKSMKFRLVGLEKVFLKGTIFGMILYFTSLLGKSKSDIYKWSIMQAPKGMVQPEILLTLEIPNHKFSVLNLLYRSFNVSNISFSEKEGIIQLSKNPPSLITEPTEEQFPIDSLEKYNFDAKDIYKQISKLEFTPFDVPNYFLNYALLKDVKILNYNKEEEEEDGRISSYVFNITHTQEFPIIIKIQDKLVNQALIENFEKRSKKKKSIESLFGKIFLNRGKLEIFPLSIYENGREEFPALSEDSIDYRQALKSLYEVDKA